MRFKPKPTWAGTGEDARQLAQVAESLQTALEDLSDLPLAQGVTAPATTFTAGSSVRVGHGLGRKPIGWLVTYATGSAPLLYVTASDEQYITLTHSGASTTVATLFFF